MKTNAQVWLVPKLQDMFFIVMLIAVLSLGTQMINLDGDLPRHLMMGKYILQNRSVPSVEVFIHPNLNQPYVLHEWLTDVLFYLIFSAWGLAGLIMVSALLLATTFTLLYKGLSNRLNVRLPVLALVAWGAIATSLNWAVRPHLVSMLLLVLWLQMTENLQNGKKTPVWLFPIIMVIWSNLHGEFIAGILVLLAYAVGWLIESLFDRQNSDLSAGKRIWLAFLLSMVASLMNPNGIGPWLSVFGFVNSQYLMSRMTEVKPPDFHNPDMWILLGLLTASIFLLSIKRTKLSPGQGLLLAGFSVMSLLATRNIHFYGIVAPFVLAETLVNAKNIPVIGRLETSLQTIEENLKGFVWIATFVIVVSATVNLNQGFHALYQFKEPAFPIQAVDWLEKNPQQGNMFNDLNWGGYLGLHLWPDQPAFIDSMSDATGTLTMQYEKAITLQEGWQDIFDQYNIAWAIISPEWTLTRELKAQGWKTIYQDQTAIILIQP